MRRPRKVPFIRARVGLTLIELLLAIAAVGLLGALLLSQPTVESIVPPPALAVAPPIPPVPPAPPAPPAPPRRYYGELALQATLDQLGFTVNVPRSYHGRTIQDWRGYRLSTRDDSVGAEWFTAGGTVTFQALSRQCAMAGSTRFGAELADGTQVPLLTPHSSRPEVWVSGIFQGDRTEPDTIRRLEGRVRFFLTTGGFTGRSKDSPDGPRLFSTAADNPASTAQMLVLPARTGGEWVDEGDNTGHWEGGTDMGGYLLCWEDQPGGGDCDYQDLVVLAQDIEPVRQ